ncbi:hypothetical protein [Nesterenkonia pannonica]|uniref:hypothetical protein n=1 Tax=Nesterenkonia pannonica TaxID=1548602 RepID=UPI00216437AA|nr:hypothetical protein [Nesterenkonia pannonica]
MIELLFMGKLYLHPAGEILEQLPILAAEMPRLGVQQTQGPHMLAARSLQRVPRIEAEVRITGDVLALHKGAVLLQILNDQRIGVVNGGAAERVLTGTSVMSKPIEDLLHWRSRSIRFTLTIGTPKSS